MMNDDMSAANCDCEKDEVRHWTVQGETVLEAIALIGCCSAGGKGTRTGLGGAKLGWHVSSPPCSRGRARRRGRSPCSPPSCPGPSTSRRQWRPRAPPIRSACADSGAGEMCRSFARELVGRGGRAYGIRHHESAALESGGRSPARRIGRRGGSSVVWRRRVPKEIVAYGKS
jgi:hypothetical protein